MERKFLALLFALFAIFVFNGCSSGGGSDLKPTYTPVANVPNIYGISVGINDYPSPDELNCCVKDSVAMVQALKYGSQNNLWSRANITPINNTHATKSVIMSKLNEIAAKIGENDIFFMYYSGHGNAEDSSGASSPDDAVTLSGETYIIPVDSDGTDNTAISSAEIKEILAKMPDNTKKILIFDACFSGGFIGKSANYNSRKLALKYMALSHSKREYYPNEELGFKNIGKSIKNVFFTTASSYNELSYENRQVEHGAYTYHLLQGLGANGDNIGHAGSPGGMIGIRELYDYAYEPTVQTTFLLNIDDPDFHAAHPQLYTSTENANCNIKGNL